MQPYATVSEPSPLNGNRTPVINSNSNNLNKSFFTEYRSQILYSIGVIVAILFLTIAFKKKRFSFYDHGKIQTGKKTKKDKKDKKGKKCPKGCSPVTKKVIKNSKKGTSFDPALTDKKPTVKPIQQ
tara:strand:- start:291 stop:668 length:378 start_codon:yes stop_codon:yes gene_type:complete